MNVQHRTGWNLLRMGYYALLFTIFVAFGFFWGPRLINYGKMSALTVNDFIPVILDHGVPTVQYLYRYRAANGQFPENIPESVPGQKKTGDAWDCWADFCAAGIDPPEYSFNAFYHGFYHKVTYVMSPYGGYWKVAGKIVNGRAPLEPVKIADEPATETTRP